MVGPFEDIVLQQDGKTAVFSFKEGLHQFGIDPTLRGVHGGCIIAMAIQSSIRVISQNSPKHNCVCTCTGSFVSAGKVGECLAVVEILKQTKNYTHALTRLMQGKEVVHVLSVVLSASFVGSQPLPWEGSKEEPVPSTLQLAAPSIERIDNCIQSADTQYWNPGSLLGYGRHVDLRFDPRTADRIRQSHENVKPSDGDIVLNAWVRMESNVSHSFASTAFISDFASAGIQAFAHAFMRSYPTHKLWDATLSMTVHWYQDPAALTVTSDSQESAKGSPWLQLQIASRKLSFHRHEFQVVLWAPDGSLVCTSSQLQIVKIMSKL
eukprot:gnl/MRDRNA2_/MRDRNA2_309681_c0_seq1.p1 gnl/MRDRNA2_/MRDRNA2_309681_c0~~gnl/MRDRNA2_/MRDRNA2_309681_c0_seq1.p1  ORF type:complete len:322 (+),score=45.99 gnl/MRDRNA2_/MRDRNA2_309681_c0_seq1:92-1057(+)